MDLLTAVLRAMGQLAGPADDRMADALAAGTRRVDALDQVFASWA